MQSSNHRLYNIVTVTLWLAALSSHAILLPKLLREIGRK